MIVPLDHTICEVTLQRHALCVELNDGRTLCAPLDWFPILEAVRRERLAGFVVADDGLSIAWPDLGETVSVEMLLARRSVAPSAR